MGAGAIQMSKKVSLSNTDMLHQSHRPITIWSMMSQWKRNYYRICRPSNTGLLTLFRAGIRTSSKTGHEQSHHAHILLRLNRLLAEVNDKLFCLFLYPSKHSNKTLITKWLKTFFLYQACVIIVFSVFNTHATLPHFTRTLKLPKSNQTNIVLGGRHVDGQPTKGAAQHALWWFRCNEKKTYYPVWDCSRSGQGGSEPPTKALCPLTAALKPWQHYTVCEHWFSLNNCYSNIEIFLF